MSKLNVNKQNIVPGVFGTIGMRLSWILMKNAIRKAVFPVAGLGTRMYSASKSIPKEMLTLVDRPIIDWVVEEARTAGIKQFTFITARDKSSMEDHFDAILALDQAFARTGSLKLLDTLQD
jgi:UTP--glucose-1-phosphate uridylyltransferase